MTEERLNLRILGRTVELTCTDAETFRRLGDVYGAMHADGGPADLRYTAGKRNDAEWFIERGDGPVITLDDGRDLLTRLNDDIAIELQKLRTDLYFVHAAVVEVSNRAVVLAAQAGQGKSTTTWALLHHGFRFVSDELAPVDLESMRVHPFPRAIGFKSSPPESYPLPDSPAAEGPVTYVPVDGLPAETVAEPLPVGALVFVRYDSGAAAPSIEPLGDAEAAALLYANALNPLAHEGDGLDGALRIARHAGCFQLVSADLPRTCGVLKDAVRGA